MAKETGQRPLTTHMHHVHLDLVTIYIYTHHCVVMGSAVTVAILGFAASFGRFLNKTVDHKSHAVFTVADF